MKALMWIVAGTLLPSPLHAQVAVSASSPSVHSPTTAEVVYPNGSRVGMVPFEGSKTADDFQGFADLATKRSVMIIELPEEAREMALDDFVAPDALKSQGLTALSRRIFKVAEGTSTVDAIEVKATQTALGMTFPKCLVVFHASDFTALISAQMPMDKSGDACALIKDLRIRGALSKAGKLAALPFTIGSMGGFSFWDTVGGSGVILSTDRNGQSVVPQSQPMIVIARALADRMVAEKDRVEFSTKSLHATTSFEQAKIVSQSMVAGAKVPTSEVIGETHDQRVVQWIQFQPDGYTIRIIAEAPKADFDALMPRFKAIRDGVTPRADAGAILPR